MLLAVAGYTYRDRDRPPRARSPRSAQGCGTLEHVVHVPYGRARLPDATGWGELLAEGGPLEFEPVAVRPSALRAVLLGHHRAAEGDRARARRHARRALQGPGPGLGPQARRARAAVHDHRLDDVERAGLGAAAARVDRDDRRRPGVARADYQWRLAGRDAGDAHRRAPGVPHGLPQGGDRDRPRLRLASIRALVVAGSPLPGEGFHYVYEQLGPDVLLLNGSGGTDVCSALVTGHFRQPVYEGEIASRCLGVAAKAFDFDGDEVVGELGEFVVTEPMPSMPVRFWNDPATSATASAYFEHYPGVWRQGDWSCFTERGSCVITGPLGRDAQPRRRPHGHERALRRRRGARRRSPTASIVHLEDDEGGAGELAAVRRAGRRARARRRAARADRGHAALGALAAPRARHDRRRAGDPAHADRQEARDAGQADPAGSRADGVASRDALADPAAIDAFVAFAAASA